MATKWKLNMMSSIALFNLSHMSLFYNENKLRDHDGSRVWGLRLQQQSQQLRESTQHLEFMLNLHEPQSNGSTMHGEGFDPRLNHIDFRVAFANRLRLTRVIFL